MNKRLRELRKNILKLTLKNFGESIGLSPSGISDIESERTPLQERHIKLICQTFNVNEEWLRNGEEPIFKEDKKEKSLIELIEEEYNIKPMAKSIIEKYLSLDETKQSMFEEFVIELFEEYNINYKKNTTFTQIPKYTLNNTAEEELSVTLENNIVDSQDIKIYDTPVSAGKGSFINDYEPFDTIKVNLKTCPQARRCDFALKVRGDSMEPYYYDGDIVFVKEQPSLDNGQIGIFIYEDEAYIKKYSLQEDGVYLISLNKNYPPIKIDENNAFKICGLVLTV